MITHLSRRQMLQSLCGASFICGGNGCSVSSLPPSKPPINPHFGESPSRWHALAIATKADNNGVLTRVRMLQDAELCYKVAKAIFKPSHMRPVVEITWDVPLYLVLFNKENNELKAFCSDCGRTVFFPAEVRHSNGQIKVFKVERNVTLVAESRPRRVFYGIEATSLIQWMQETFGV